MQVWTTGTVVSGVWATHIICTPSCTISSWATVAAVFEFDSESRSRISIAYVAPPIATPAANTSRRASSTNESASPNAASAPVCGVT